MAADIYVADVRGLDEARARFAGRSRRPGSAFAASLLACALRARWGASGLPDFGLDELGRPFFPARPDWHFSLSHTRGFVLAAVSDGPIGADIEAMRPAPERLLRTMDEAERRDFAFLELWVLRESFYKLRGHGDLRALRFRRGPAGILAPEPGVYSRLYGDVAGCRAAACARAPLPERLIPVPAAEICT